VDDETRVPPPRPSEKPPLPGLIPPGTVLFGVYEVLDQLGSGGMGDVYRARHRRLGGLRAIKVINPAFAGRAEAVEFFYREARAMLEVHDDAVVRCHDLLTGDDGQVYLVMEMVNGRSLSDWIQEGPLSESAVRALGARIASGLAAAHRRGVVHRDLSPDNILLSEDRPDQAKVIDFGIAKILESGDQTVVTGFKGKLSYASPEQFGMFGGDVSARSDLYSLGLVLVAAATGEPIPMGVTVAEAVHARQQSPRLPPTVPAGLRAEIAPLLAPDPAHRPASAEGLFGTPSPLEEESRGWAPRPGSLLVALAAIALAAALILVPDLRSTLSELPSLITFPVNEVEPSDSQDEADVITSPVTEVEEPSDSQDEADDAPLDAFDRVRAQLLELEPASDTGARIWTAPDPVPSGATYRLAIEADCDCAALLFSIDGSEDEIALLYPNNHDPRVRLVAGHPLILPSPGANPPYALNALGGGGEDTLKLLLFRGDLGFPAEIAFFTTAQRGESLVWSATREDRERLEELAELLEGEIWSTAQTPLRILESATE
jgi:serine/threonine protein kinase